MKPQTTISKQDIEKIKAWRKSPLLFVKDVWKLIPQPLKPEYEAVTHDAPLTAFKKNWFEPFEFGKHLTWQQWLIFRAVEKAMSGTGSNRISVASGHGIGKSSAIAMLILWYLFVFKDAQVAATAPTSDQIHDVLWKEIKVWLDKMPKWMSEKYDHTTGYVRIKEREKTWFARAKTARKENPEALAGVHGEHVFVVVDEASGVPEEVYKTAEGILTSKNILAILISNPTRLVGYFYDSHRKDKEYWQTLSFSGEDSPIVEQGYCDRIIMRYGKDSDEYRVRVLGQFPKEDAVDKQGYVPLITADMMRYIPDIRLDVGTLRLGVDVAGEGSDKSIWVLRDAFKAKIVLKENKSTNLMIAARTNGIFELHKVLASKTWVDNFGEGANVAMELVKLGKVVNSINVGDKAEESERYINKRAEAYWRMREWLMKGGQLIGNAEDWQELLTIRYKPVEITGRLKIMGKEEMRKEGFKSPDVADALMLTFIEPDLGGYRVVYEDLGVESTEQFNPYSVI